MSLKLTPWYSLVLHLFHNLNNISIFRHVRIILEKLCLLWRVCLPVWNNSAPTGWIFMKSVQDINVYWSLRKVPIILVTFLMKDELSRHIF
jgi:hypothetical protein